ncbi:glycosyltransferase family 4 protein [Pseudomonadota bacterium]
MKKILAIYPYAILPPVGGGALRCLNLLKQLARENELHAIVHQRKSEWDKFREEYSIPDTVVFYSALDEIPPPTIFDRLPKKAAQGLKYRWIRRSWRGPAESTVLRNYHLVEMVLKAHNVDFVLFESLSTMAAAPLVGRRSPHSIRILDAHNIDHKLLIQQLASDHEPVRRKSLERSMYKARWLESNLSRFIETFWACSEEDRSYLSKTNGIEGTVIPNGVDTNKLSFDENFDEKVNQKLLFVGSLTYEPNIDGIRWFHSTAWQVLRQNNPRLKLVVVGKGGIPQSFPELDADESVDLVGEVPDIIPYYRRGGIAIVPLRMGSGTRLKILEALSLGNPVVSTTLGAEGIETENGKSILIAENPSQFVEQIEKLQKQGDLVESLRKNGRKLVEEKYDWKVSGEKARSHICQLVNQRESSG